jgi:NitT/TauT family transport system substrate-binding protein
MIGQSSLRSRRWVIGLAAGAVASGLLPVSAASAETDVRLAYLVADSMLPALVAEEKGYFAAEGIKTEFIAVQGGPAVVSAVASGEADIGYAAPVPPINAHLSGLPIKMFLELGQEAEPDKKFVWLVASKASGITDLASAKGKKISFNANGGLCELAWRDHLRTAGLKIEDVQPVVLPFPQQEAALEQGNIDATCTINPFYSSIGGNANIGAVTIAAGTLADLKQPLMNDALFATEAWLTANQETAARIARIMDKTRKELLADRAALEAAAVKFMELTPEAAKSFQLPIATSEMTIDMAGLQRILDAMVDTGMQQGPLKAEDFAITLQY